MARIRTVKPEFWRDEKIASLKNKLAGYFFIALWNVADDEGKFKLNPKALALQCPIFRSKEIVTYLSELSQKGLIRKSVCSQWGLITKWKHQKIDRPIVPEIKVKDIQWLDECDSTNCIEDSSSIRRKDRIGKDSIKDSIGSLSSKTDSSSSNKNEQQNHDSKNLKPTQKTSRTAKPPSLETNKVIARYIDLWKERYKGDAPVGGRAAGQFKSLVKEVGGVDKAITYVEAYLQMPDSWFVTKRHDIWTLMSNLNSVSQFIATGKLITKSEIRQLDNAVTNQGTIDALRNGEL